MPVSEKTCPECGAVFAACHRRRFCSLQCAFWARVDKSDPNPDACWLWTGYASPQTGYGVVGADIAGKRTSAHRYAYRLTIGDIPAGMLICHRCDNRRCCRPSHLFAGSQRENLADAIAKGRRIWTAPGEAHPFHKLDETAVRQIRTTAEQTKVLAERYGVNRSTIRAARSGATWAHVR